VGQRGPKAGWKKGAAAAVAPEAAARQAEKQPKPVVAEVHPPPPAQAPEAAKPEQPRMSAADLSNPAKLTGDALKKLAHSLGMAKSELARLDDDKIRVQLKYLTHRKYETAEA
jgi:hypothetical protein